MAKRNPVIGSPPLGESHSIGDASMRVCHWFLLQFESKYY